MKGLRISFGAALALSLVVHAAVALVGALIAAKGQVSAVTDSGTPLDVDVIRVQAAAAKGAAARQEVPSEAAKAAPATAATPAVAATPAAATTTTTTPASAAGASPGSVSISDSGGARVLTPAEYGRWVRAHNPPPAYPRASNEAREQGKVIVLATVRRDGTLESVMLQSGSGHERLDQSALEAVRSWTFPAFDGDEEKLTLRFPFKFELYE